MVRALQADLAVEGVEIRRCTPAPLPGRRGNREVLALLTAARSAAAGVSVMVNTAGAAGAVDNAGTADPVETLRTELENY